jgi:signal-transduction protein with cAMP-binding, CBS, and nucleotidyltransferase domain
VGILTERDYMRKVILRDRASKQTRVEEIMTRRVIYVDLECTVEECMALMTERRIRHLPVLEEDNLVGVVSIGDVVKAVIAARGVLIDQLERYIQGDHPT